MPHYTQYVWFLFFPRGIIQKYFCNSHQLISDILIIKFIQTKLKPFNKLYYLRSDISTHKMLLQYFKSKNFIAIFQQIFISIFKLRPIFQAFKISPDISTLKNIARYFNPSKYRPIFQPLQISPDISTPQDIAHQVHELEFLM